ncbi:C-C chemokine receptor type 9a [Denticeps clupeoides]|uniref:G-protein coupled receptors family 1 profile domain-containing protein n=1 Tax=Denticeps clupeoides TaxID=299321 RepID=A0AAY4AUL1_9TELE|nr:C-C chemokine receptor type 9-like [Denticeps clupeoides]
MYRMYRRYDFFCCCKKHPLFTHKPTHTHTQTSQCGFLSDTLKASANETVARVTLGVYDIGKQLSRGNQTGKHGTVCEMAQDTTMDALYNDEYTTPTEGFDDTYCDKSVVRDFRKYYEPPLYSAIVLLGAVGNMLVIWIYLHFRNRMKTMTDVYLFNLAVADLLFLVTLPFWVSDAVQGWTFGSALCKLLSACYKINFFSSMLLLTCISVDRYIAIVQTTTAQNSKKLRLFWSKLVCVFVWVLAVFLSMPEFLFATSKEDFDDPDWNYCSMVYWNNKNNRTKILVLALQICMGFCLPLVVMIFCYTIIILTLMKTKNFEKHKALRVILAVVAVFVLTQLPYNTMLVVDATQAANMTITDCSTIQGFDITSQVMKGLAYMHCCLNPFLYAFVGVRFRKDLVRILHSYGLLERKRNVKKPYGVQFRASVMSETDTTQALSL